MSCILFTSGHHPRIHPEPKAQDIILGGNHSQMAALNLRSRLAEVLLDIQESSKAPPLLVPWFLYGSRMFYQRADKLWQIVAMRA